MVLTKISGNYSLRNMLDYLMICGEALLPLRIYREPVCGRINIDINSNNNRAD